MLTQLRQDRGRGQEDGQDRHPRELLEHIIELGLKVKDARIVSLQFVPPQFYTGSPDWQKIRAATRQGAAPLAAARPPPPGRDGLARRERYERYERRATPAATPKPSRTAVAGRPEPDAHPERRGRSPWTSSVGF
ncbi:hypothetical protein [Streptosporangium vulgare]|uniref:hypothetical protein n=1 Tax=Streptosporangium vulgare TaxID=46190 RepID=UPI0031E39FFA